MDFLKALFNDGALTYEQFVAAAQGQKMNLVDLSKGGYVSQAKHDDKIKELNGRVDDLTGQINKRDADLTALHGQLDAVQADAGKLADAQKSLADLQKQYQTEHDAYESRIAQQRYEFNIRERANGLRFSSAAAKKAFMQEAINKGFKQDGESLLGYDEFVAKYKADDPGAFVQDNPDGNTPTTSPQIITKPGKEPPNNGKRLSLSEMMRLKNENPNAAINFDS